MKLKIITIVSLLFLTGCSGKPGENIMIGNRYFIYEIGADGKNLRFVDKSSGIDYLDHGKNSHCASIVREGEPVTVTSAIRKGTKLQLGFGSSGVTAVIEFKSRRDRIVYRIISVTGSCEALTFLNIPLKLEGIPSESFGACALSMNLITHVRQVPALMTELRAVCYSKFGTKGAEVTLLGLPVPKMLPVIREVMAGARDIPHSDKGGAWAQMQKEGYGSVLYSSLTEETVDDHIGMCRNLGFTQIDNPVFRHGDHALDTLKYPGGWDSFKRINARLHEAGLYSIFHSFALLIAKSSVYVTPVPSEDLAWFSKFSLASPLNEKDDEIVVNEPTDKISTITGLFIRNGVTLRLGTELITFTGVTRTPPWKFTGCRRGAQGTAVTSHPAGTSAFHLREVYNHFVPGPETALFKEIAEKTAEVVNYCNFDGIYFDAIDLSDVVAGEEDFWYYSTKFLFEVALRLNRPVGMTMSSMAHHWWHFRSRWQAWDKPVRGYKRFIDVHSASVKSPALFLTPDIRYNEYEHAMWRGNSPFIDKYAAEENGALLLPLHFGWWGLHTWNPPQMEPTFPDDIEYLCCKMTGNNACLTILGGVDEKTLESTPLFRELTGIIRQYEELRHQNYFSDTVRALLRKPGKEFTLFREKNGEWNFKPVSYQKHKVTGLNHPSSAWNVTNEFASQPVKVRIEPLMSVTPFRDPGNVVLANFHGKEEFAVAGSAEGITGRMDPSKEESPAKGKSVLFFAESTGASIREGSWLKMEKRFNPWLDLSKNKALGVWIKGDSNGELLNLRIESPRQISLGARGDHFVNVDFTGWRYFELVETESSETTHYLWPDSGLYMYDIYRHSVRFDVVDKLQLWYNNLPAGKKASCTIGEIRALQMVPAPISNPALTVNGETILFPVTMEPGMYLEFRTPNRGSLYGPKGNLLQSVEINKAIPLLKEGENRISFECQGMENINPRVQVTVIAEGEPLDIR